MKIVVLVSGISMREAACVAKFESVIGIDFDPVVIAQLL